jgi:Asp-tRNA(Asn)/Glu-tRNA(Gln) amidotransferase A subunit family amidase
VRFVGNLPVGLHVIGPLYREDTVLRVCRAYESAHPIPHPPL